MGHMLTEDQFTEGFGDLYYTGPLEVAQEFMRKTAGVTVQRSGEYVEVLFGHDGQEAVTWENANEWGRAHTEEEAWRFALGAAFGPIDAEFEPFDIGGDE